MNGVPCPNVEIQVTVMNGEVNGFYEDLWGNRGALTGIVGSNGNINLSGSSEFGPRVWIDGSVTGVVMGGSYNDSQSCFGYWYAYR